jgi:hypothetical protein
MTIHDLKANTAFPDPIEDDERFAALIYSQIHSLISQLHQHRKLRPEHVVKLIAQQYADDYLSHSPSSADHPRDDEFANRFSISSNPSYSGNQRDWETWTPLTDLFSIPLSAHSFRDRCP